MGCCFGGMSSGGILSSEGGGRGTAALVVVSTMKGALVSAEDDSVGRGLDNRRRFCCKLIASLDGKTKRYPTRNATKTTAQEGVTRKPFIAFCRRKAALLRPHDDSYQLILLRHHYSRNNLRRREESKKTTHIDQKKVLFALLILPHGPLLSR